VYKKIKPISFDYAVMEKMKNQACVPCDLAWSDMGSWDQIAELFENNKSKQNQLQSKVINEGAKNNFAFTNSPKTVAFVGCDDLIVADTADALLVMKKGQSQKVKDVYAQLQKSQPALCEGHNFEYRPWGSFQILSEAEDYKSKLITVNPGEQLSYQSHTKRAEHWIVISGQAEVVLDDEVIKLKGGEHIFIPQGAKHRMRNPGKIPMQFVEVQTGTYFGEDDIKRFQDNYNRV
jgi:mannose-1-phosphate guanylyltransferase/mannose-6-phosphate isomerase